MRSAALTVASVTRLEWRRNPGFTSRPDGLVVAAMMADTLRDFIIQTPTIAGDNTMSKSQDSKKQTKKEPTKTLKEKRAAKKEKKK